MQNQKKGNNYINGLTEKMLESRPEDSLGSLVLTVLSVLAVLVALTGINQLTNRDVV